MKLSALFTFDLMQYFERTFSVVLENEKHCQAQLQSISDGRDFCIWQYAFPTLTLMRFVGELLYNWTLVWKLLVRTNHNVVILT